MTTIWLWTATWAGPLGPSEDGVTVLDTGSDVELPGCGESWPYRLEQLGDSPDLWFRFNPEHSFGTDALVSTIASAAARVALLYPDSDPLLVGDLSKADGGTLPPHRYHGDGRSADLGLYLAAGVSADQYREGNGFPRVTPGELDLERTWTLIESLIDSGTIEHILLDQSHIDRLSAWLVETGRRTPEEVARTFPPANTPGLWGWDGIVRSAPNHKEHLHVRVRCE